MRRDGKIYIRFELLVRWKWRTYPLLFLNMDGVWVWTGFLFIFYSFILVRYIFCSYEKKPVSLSLARSLSPSPPHHPFKQHRYVYFDMYNIIFLFEVCVIFKLFMLLLLFLFEGSTLCFIINPGGNNLFLCPLLCPLVQSNIFAIVVASSSLFFNILAGICSTRSIRIMIDHRLITISSISLRWVVNKIVQI